ncbi:hypothetical protein SDC9_50860 [bioreactor metagenome]|uniref:Prepilin-type N-terminal cleavage/methylation domain-containing protein n=1 Tax=bioreactor metagenome TaxID=1076179 RepID=A0A644WLC0_9ZZZZ
MRYLHNKKGFTLIELIVAMMVFAILGGAIAGVLKAGLSSYGHISDDMYSETDARAALSLITVQIRQHDATGAITVDGGGTVLRLKSGSDGDSGGTLIWFDSTSQTLYSYEATSDVATLDPSFVSVSDASAIAKINSLELKQKNREDGTNLPYTVYTVTIKYTKDGGKELSQTVTQRSAPADATPTT